MISSASDTNQLEQPSPTLWGLDPTQLHDRFWAARGIQVIRKSSPVAVDRSAELYLLTDRNTLVIFKLRELMDPLNWVRPDLLYARLDNGRDPSYRETVVTDADGEFVRFQRHYDTSDAKLQRVALTPDSEVAETWAHVSVPVWPKLRPRTVHRLQLTLSGTAYHRFDNRDVRAFMHELIQVWKRPDATIPRIKSLCNGVWVDEDAQVDPDTEFIGPSWIGAGRRLDADDNVVGPAAWWDDPEMRPPESNVDWGEIEPTEVFHGSNSHYQRPARKSQLADVIKRACDITFAATALTFTIPLYPFVMLAIMIEDGWPFFFGHSRETIGKRRFACLKFRSMRKDAEKVKAQMKKENQADGPQFFVKNDRRLTKVGRFIRRFHIDELPQFWNVLVGHMSVVGPRPSPFEENQCCPTWREARLSVRPGVTGLWQVMRSRQKGLDFQEWIKYDIEYVENRSFRLDLWIIYKTVYGMIRR